MRLILVIGAIVISVVMAALATDLSYAEDEDHACTNCPTESHSEPGRYRLYAATSYEHLHARSKRGITRIETTKGPNSFDYLGNAVKVDADRKVFKIEYTATEAGATIVIDFHDDVVLWAPIRLDGQGSTSGSTPQPTPAPTPRPWPPSSPTNTPPTLTGTTAIAHPENATGPVATYTATDPEGLTIIWTLSGTDGADFSIIEGDLTFNAGPDYEDPTDADKDNVYDATVRASDGTNTVTLNVTVTVSNVNEAPQFPGSGSTRSVAENTAAGENVGAPVEATDPEDDSLTYALGGTDAAFFDIAASTGQLLTKAALDRSAKSSYSVTVSVSDGKNADGNADAATDGTIDVTIEVTGATVGSGSSQTTLLKSIPRQFVPINGGAKTLLLSEYFLGSDQGYPPYDVTKSASAIATVEVSEGYLTITPKGIGVATTTLTVTDTPGIREEFKTIVYRPVLPRTDTESVHIVDPEVETTLTSSDGSLVVTLPANARDEFFQAAIDALSNDCGRQAPVGQRSQCVLVGLFDLAAESVEESLDRSATLSVIVNSQQYDAVQTDIANGDFTMWKGHGPSDPSWDEIPECEEPRGQSECFSLIQADAGGKITVFNIVSFSQFAAGIVLLDPPPSQPPSTSPPTDNTGGGGGSSSGGSSRTRSVYEYRGNQAPQIFGEYIVTYQENGTEPVGKYTAKDPDDDEITWSLLGRDRRKFEISNSGVLNFRSPPDYENPDGLRGNTYWVIVQAEDDGKPSEYDVHNVYVTVTQVNELGTIIGDSELSVAERHTGPIIQYEVDDPEKGVITWTLSGPDASGFDIDSQGSLTSVVDLDFETPSSSVGSNVHALTITATDDGQPELSAQLDVTLTVSNVNEAPQVSIIPDVDLTTRHLPWMLDLAEFFTDPDGDSLSYEISGRASTDVAHAAVDGGTLSITPAGEGITSFYVVAADSGGLSAVGKVAVSVTEPAPTPVPAKVTAPVPTETPAPEVVADITTPSIAPLQSYVAALDFVAAPEPSPTYVPLSLMSERRLRNLTQQPDSVSKVIVAFAVEPVDAPKSELTLPSMPTPAPAQSVSAPEIDAVAVAQGQAPSSVAVDEDGEGMQVWLTILLILIAILIAGYSVRMFVIHRL